MIFEIIFLLAYVKIKNPGIEFLFTVFLSANSHNPSLNGYAAQMPCSKIGSLLCLHLNNGLMYK